jgi:glutathione synthase/RimK-type ligase-like ATP-grasp enzyme
MEITVKPVGVFYEHPSWFKPLFEELTRRHIPFVRIQAAHHQYNPAERDAPYSLVVNRTSASAVTGGGSLHGISHAANYLAHLERMGVPVVNGAAVHRIESSRARQLSLFATLGLPFPRTRIINHIDQVIPAALSLQFPVLVKANVSGGRAVTIRFDRLTDLQRAVELQQIDLGLDHTALVQELIVTKKRTVVRVETLNGRFLFAVKIHTTVDQLDQCRRDLFRCAADVQVERYAPPTELIFEVERVVREARLDVGGVEYVVDDEHQVYFMNIDSLSYFTANTEAVSDIDPHRSFVDYIEGRLEQIRQRRRVLAL